MGLETGLQGFGISCDVTCRVGTPGYLVPRIPVLNDPIPPGLRVDPNPSEPMLAPPLTGPRSRPVFHATPHSGNLKNATSTPEI